MRQIGWILFGALLAMAGQAVAQQSWYGTDTQGTGTYLYELGQGAYGWSNSRGQGGTITPLGSPSIQPLKPC